MRALTLVALVTLMHTAWAELALPANGGFEELTPAGQPAAWQYVCANGCNGAMAVDSDIKAEGARSVRLSSASPVAPHVYCGIAQDLRPLEPGVKYEIVFRAKGQNVGACWYGGGPEWKIRQMFPSGSFDWMECAMECSAAEGQDSFHFRINVDSVTEALWIDDVRVVTMAEIGARAIALIEAQEQRLPAIEAQLEATRKEGLPVFYPRSDLVIARLFCQYCREDVANDRCLRAVDVATDVKDLLDRAERTMRAGVDVPVYKLGTATIRDGSFFGQCAYGGREETRPIFFTGYGHFGGAVEALPIFEQIGINIIQIEIGPNSVVNEDGSVNTARIDDLLAGPFERAKAHGAAICLLLSPHYFPDWAFAKWPDIQVGNGFLHNSVEAPQAREVYERSLRAIIPRIKDHPALHSICLSNEPVYMNSAQDPYRLPLWHEYLKQHHGSVEAVNARYGTSHAWLADVAHPRLAFDENPPALYDAVRFNEERFAEWHGWMAGIIRAIAPNLACHAKVMCIPSGRDTLFWGTDPAQFAELSQINGNDCYMYPESDSASPWESAWRFQNMYYDLERAMKRVPVFNTENHIIRDRWQPRVKASHIYTAIWQGAIHGQGASTTWAWERTYDAKSDFEGLILHRAACTAAMSQVALDLMRLSWEVSALQNVAPRVALLYSNAAQVHDPRFADHSKRAYEALNFCGVPVGFVTDEQVAAGRLAEYDALILAGARAVPKASTDAIRAYIAGGKKVLAYGADAVTLDEYARAMEPVAGVIAVPEDLQGEPLRDVLLQELKGAGIAPEFLLATADGRAPYGVEWRSATRDGKPLLNLVNLKREPCEIAMPPGTWRDLIQGHPLGATVTLAPNTPILARKEAS